MKEIIEKCIEKNKTISTMESCTGGGLVNSFTNIEGSSNVIKFSAVTYSNEFKIKMGVEKDIIDKYTVYSMETAISMAKAITNYTNCDYGIGITGKLNRIDEANPYGEDNQVFIAIFDKEKNKFYKETIKVEEKSRKENKQLVINKVKEILLNIL
ncbi:MAG: CinA family protein [Bacilli bacterium]|nr:CinA family protein [Bacilli bacterium]